MKPLNSQLLEDVNQAAIYLLGCQIRRTLPDGTILKARIVETESYHQEDPASHTFGGQTERNKAMFGPPGHAYIYFTYGVHWCFNVTAGTQNYGAGVLIRAVEPLSGLETMQQLRHSKDTKQLTNGPAKLAQALAIDKTLYGHDLTQPPLQVFESIHTIHSDEIMQTTRVGISKNVEEVARFYVKDSPWVSKP